MPINDEDRLIIKAAIDKGGKPWDDDTIEPIKRKIKDHYRHPHGGQCCYCRRPFTGEFNMVIDIEHVLPKSVFGDLMFELFNLNISCKRCNMWIKKERIDFLIDEATIRSNLQVADQYKFVHPNLDVYKDHISYLTVRIDDQILIKYINKTNKGDYTYEFFELEKLEIDAFDKAQGIEELNQLDNAIAQPIIDQATELLKNL